MEGNKRINKLIVDIRLLGKALCLLPDKRDERIPVAQHRGESAA